MVMSIPYESHGRRQQKGRTRAALIEGARAILADGVIPTVEQAAQRAGIARTTAYRYFRNQAALLLAIYPELDERSLLGDNPPADVASRLDIVIENITEQILEHEQALRAQLRIALEMDPSGDDPLPLRQGRAIRWTEDALSPLRDRLSEPEFRRLVLATRAAVGIEALVWLTDVGHLSREEAVETMRWSARALLRSTVDRLAT